MDMKKIKGSINELIRPEVQTAADKLYYEGVNKYYEKSPGTHLEKLQAFAKYTPMADINKFLARYHIFQNILHVQGDIIECGVYKGAGLMSWAVFSSILEPLNHHRKVRGFDTFTGFGQIHRKDRGGLLEIAQKGGLATNAYDDLTEAIRKYDLFRVLGHIPKVYLHPGDATKSIPAFLKKNRHLVVALLYLDFDVYAPTKCAIGQLLPRMPKGAVIAFDELNQIHWPGETLAVLESVGIRNLRIQRLPFQPSVSFAVLE
jgi:hypothetical protein